MTLIPQSLVRYLLLDHDARDGAFRAPVAWAGHRGVSVEVGRCQRTVEDLDLIRTDLGGQVKQGLVLPVQVIQGLSLLGVLTGQLLNLWGKNSQRIKKKNKSKSQGCHRPRKCKFHLKGNTKKILKLTSVHTKAVRLLLNKRDLYF